MLDIFGVKKNMKSSSERKRIAKQRNKFAFLNFFVFLLIFIFLGVLSVGMINMFFFDNLYEEMHRGKLEIQKSIVETDERITFDNSLDARMMLCFYGEDKELIATSDSIYAFLIEDYYYYAGVMNNPHVKPHLKEKYLEEIEKAKSHSILKLNTEFNKIFNLQKVKTGDQTYRFMVMSFEIDSLNAPSVKACKMLIMVNGEFDATLTFSRIYITCVGAIITLCVIASIFLGYKAIKPLVEALDKQMKFVGDASHELRTPLSIVHSKLENILARQDDTVYDVSEDIAISLKELSRLNKLTNDLLSLAKSDYSHDAYHIENARIDEIVNETAEIFSEMAEIQNKVFSCEIEEVNAKADGDKIKQLIIILLDNALRYTNTGDSIAVTLKNSGNDYILKVADTGIGMSDETMKHAFERFYRADKARSRATGGNGLGLSIAATIVEKHQGKILINHNEPKGTVLTVVLSKKVK